MIMRGIGGDRMQEEGVELFWHFSRQNYMGFVEIIRHLPAIFRNFRITREDMLRFQPDLVIMVDYPAFNLRLTDFCKQQGYKVVYYISPQVWAWKTSRVKKIRRSVDLLLSILPFEEAFYARYDIRARFTGHPLAGVIRKYRESHWVESAPGAKKRVVLLPGSRKMEIRNMLPAMLKAMEPYRDRYEFVIAGAPSVPFSLYESVESSWRPPVITGNTYNLLNTAHAALVTSGTATLETALFRVPQVVLYKGNPVSYHIARRLIKVSYISLVNLILDKPAVKELIQYEMTPANIAASFEDIAEGQGREVLLSDYDRLIDMLGSRDSYHEAAMHVNTLMQQQ